MLCLIHCHKQIERLSVDVTLWNQTARPSHMTNLR